MAQPASPLSLSRRLTGKTELLSPGTIPSHSPYCSPQSSPNADLHHQLSCMLITLRTQQSACLQVTKENREREARLAVLERELSALKKEQMEADALIGSLVDIFADVNGREEGKDLKKEHPALYSRLRGFRERLESFLEKKRE